MQHEQVNDKAVSLSIRGAKLTGRVLAQAMQAAMRKMKKARDAPKIGRQSIKRINRTFGGVNDKATVMGRIKSFERIARKHQVSYHVEREINSDPPKYTVYWGAKQNGAVMAAFNEYMAMQLPRKKDKPSLLAKLEKFKERVKTMAAPVKKRERGGIEH